MGTERCINPVLGTFVSGSNTFRCFKDQDVVIASAAIPQLWQVRLAPIPDGETRTFTVENDVIVNSIQEYGVTTRRAWKIDLKFPQGDVYNLDIASGYQAQLGNISLVRAIYWSDLFLPKGTEVTIDGSTNDSGFFITGNIVFLATYQNITQ